MVVVDASFTALPTLSHSLPLLPRLFPLSGESGPRMFLSPSCQSAAYLQHLSSAVGILLSGGSTTGSGGVDQNHNGCSALPLPVCIPQSPSNCRIKDHPPTA
ncbi:hypothetical protein TcWFU_003682 [Taenia crassiceps]|uniref:Uncharacterized protein n=2 Tax=Taenia crassiceps TaxID=6207 RepID=A0ABR4Q2G7_9CEST